MSTPETDKGETKNELELSQIQEEPKKKKKKHNKSSSNSSSYSESSNESKEKKENKNKQQLIIKDLIAENFVMLTLIGKGAFGQIFLSYNMRDNVEVSIKKEIKKPQKTPQLKTEAKIYQTLLNISSQDITGVKALSQDDVQGVPRFYGMGEIIDCYYLIIEFLGPNLIELFNYCNCHKFTISTVCLIALQMLNRIENLHKHHYIHRDIKPENFLIGTKDKSNIVFLIDFGLSKRYKNPKNHQHIPYREGRSLTGTARYVSINTHLGIEQSRRDDLESIGYVLIFFLKGCLPWQGLKNGGDKYQRIMEKKLQIPTEILCYGLPDEIVFYLNYCKSLRFEDRPDYDYLRGLFIKLLGNCNTQYGLTKEYLKFDWCFDDPQSSIWQIYLKKNKDINLLNNSNEKNSLKETPNDSKNGSKNNVINLKSNNNINYNKQLSNISEKGRKEFPLSNENNPAISEDDNSSSMNDEGSSRISEKKSNEEKKSIEENENEEKEEEELDEDTIKEDFNGKKLVENEIEEKMDEEFKKLLLNSKKEEDIDLYLVKLLTQKGITPMSARNKTNSKKDNKENKDNKDNNENDNKNNNVNNDNNENNENNENKKESENENNKENKKENSEKESSKINVEELAKIQHEANAKNIDDSENNKLSKGISFKDEKEKKKKVIKETDLFNKNNNSNVENEEFKKKSFEGEKLKSKLKNSSISKKSKTENKLSEDPKNEDEQENTIKKIGTEQISNVEMHVSKENMIKISTEPISKNYIILSDVGHGSYGQVKKVRHRQLNEIRAMKITSKKSESSKSEIEILRKISHPNISNVYEIYEDSRKYYIMMEFLEGGELFEAITNIGSFSEQNAAGVMKQLLSAVNYLHQMNIMHRDLKPENIMLTGKPKNNQYMIKLIDFGTARQFIPGKKINKFIGTSYYIAPEVLRENYDEKCDVWSCGVILYILLCGYPPFNGNTNIDIYHNIQTQNPSFAGEEWEDITKEAIDLIKNMLNRNPLKRWNCEMCLNHKWFKLLEEAEKSRNEKNFKKIQINAISHMAKFVKENRFKQAVLQFISVQFDIQKEEGDLREIFKSMDTQGKGQLSKDAFCQKLCELYGENDGKNLTNEIFNNLDLDGSGKISYDEFLSAMISSKKVVTEDRLQKAFKMFDKDGSGKLSISEIRAVFGGDEDSWKKVISDIDLNKDGEVDYEEFKLMMLNMDKNVVFSKNYQNRHTKTAEKIHDE